VNAYHNLFHRPGFTANEPGKQGPMRPYGTDSEPNIGHFEKRFLIDPTPPQKTGPFDPVNGYETIDGLGPEIIAPH
jgi:hypothetical protein